MRRRRDPRPARERAPATARGAYEFDLFPPGALRLADVDLGAKADRDRYDDELEAPEDWRNRKRWSAYERAIQDMLDRTHRPDAPWVVVPANDKKYARLAVLREVARLLG